MMAAKVMSTNFLKHKEGTARVYMVGMDNGVEGEYFTKSGFLPFEIGDSISFETKPSKFPGQPVHILLLDTNVFPSMAIAQDPVKKAPVKQYKDEAMISAVAICKSALEGRGMRIEEVQDHITDLHRFFLNFKPQ